MGKKIIEKSRYLSVRMMFMYSCAMLYGFFMFASGAGKRNLVGNMIASTVWIAMAVLFYRLLVRPYRICEEIMEQMRAGYARLSDIQEQSFYLTPNQEKLLYAVNDLLQSDHMRMLNRRQAQYIALQKQINPHFLYNTLDSIRSEIMMAGLMKVAEMVEALAMFFRYTISKVENLVTIEEELDNCMSYFKIQQYRFGDRLQLKIDCDADDYAVIRRLMIPKLTLQPILENSIIHGIELKMGVGEITIGLEVTETHVTIHIRDNGIGIMESSLEQLNDRLSRNMEMNADSGREENREGGIALVNVNERIRLLFGDEYGLHVFSKINEGTDVCIIVPVYTNGGEQSEAGGIQNRASDLQNPGHYNT